MELEAPPLEGDLAMERLSQENSSDPEEDDDDKWGSMLPLFYDSNEEFCAAAEAEAEEADRRRREAEEKAREADEEKRRADERKRLEETAAVGNRKTHTEVYNSIRKYNPKIKRVEYTRFAFKDLSKFNLDEPSPVLAMRYTDKQTSDDCANLYSINVLSVKIISSDKGFPLNVYGSIILRDSLDYKCVYLFSRPSRMDSNLINSKDQSLILTGPSRGLFLVDYIYIEVDLKMRDRGKDKQLSIGLLQIDGRRAPWVPTTKVHCCSLESSLSTVEVRYELVEKATEATVEFQVLQGDFKGKITAHTTKIKDSTHDRMLLHDSRACGVVTSTDGSRVVQLLRRVVAVCVDEMLVLTTIPEGASTQVERFTVVPLSDV